MFAELRQNREGGGEGGGDREQRRDQRRTPLQMAPPAPPTVDPAQGLVPVPKSASVWVAEPFNISKCGDPEEGLNWKSWTEHLTTNFKRPFTEWLPHLEKVAAAAGTTYEQKMVEAKQLGDRAR
jgi:hypothetical protein